VRQSATYEFYTGSTDQNLSTPLARDNEHALVPVLFEQSIEHGAGLRRVFGEAQIADDGFLLENSEVRFPFTLPI
jgi:hypothetical protein